MAEEQKVVPKAEPEAGQAPSSAIDPLPVVGKIEEPIITDSEPPAAAAAAPVVESETVKEALPVQEPLEPPKPTDAKPVVEGEKAAAPAPDGSTPLKSIAVKLPNILEAAGHTEMWGIELSGKDETDVKTSIVLQKFLNANAGDLAKAAEQLQKALEWRKKMQPLKLLDENFNREKFDGLGYVSIYNVEGATEVVTWNIYGAVKDMGTTFGDVEEFVKWRSALMELSIQKLGIAEATKPIPATGEDPYKMIQVHDYLNVSFLRADPRVKAASKEVIQLFSTAYSELLKEKFFVNVPVLMGWFFAAMKLFISKETVKKFHPLSYGSSLAGEVGPELGEKLPQPYGGKGKDLKEEAATVKLAGSSPIKAEE